MRAPPTAAPGCWRGFRAAAAPRPLVGGGVCHGRERARPRRTGVRRRRRGPRCRSPGALADACVVRCLRAGATNTGARSAPPGVHSLKAHLGHELRALATAWADATRRIGERRGGALEFLSALQQHADDFIVQTRADVSGVAQRLAFPEAEQQRPQRFARAPTACVAADHKLGRLAPP